MTAYATATDAGDYIEGLIIDDPAAFGRLLERASRDVDSVIGPLRIIATGAYAGFKLDPTTLLDWQAKALARATCAQAEYRLMLGEEALSGKVPDRGAVKSEEGPDFKRTYSDPAPTAVAVGRASGRYSPKLADELAPLGLPRRAGRMR